MKGIPMNAIRESRGFDKIEKDKMVHHPDHYQSNNGLEVIDVIEAFTEGLEGIEATDTGNIIKYACRWSKKNGIQDLKKIIWYAEHLIKHLNEVDAAIGDERYTPYTTPSDIIFSSMDDANKVLNSMSDVISDYGYVTVGDLCDLSDVNSSGYIDQRYGWTSITSASVEMLNDCEYVLKLQEPIDIKTLSNASKQKASKDEFTIMDSHGNEICKVTSNK